MISGRFPREALNILLAPLFALLLAGCGSSGSAGTSGGGSQDAGNDGNPNGLNTGNSGAGTCIPKTCADQGIECGPAGDGCGGIIADCGKCDAGLRCGGPNALSKCVSPTVGSGCVPKSCAELGVECGPAGDGCGGLLTCGSCASGQQCGANGSPSKCVAAVPTSADGGACAPKTAAEYKLEGKNCGEQSDGCGSTLSLGQCAAPEFCGGGGPSRCGVQGGGTCTRKTCVDFPGTCGPQPDGCGGVTADCGSCASPAICGGGGIASKCGGGSVLGADGGSCVPITKCSVGQCGKLADGCGGVLDCGSSCASGQICGGAGTPNVCATPKCAPLTQCPAGMNCGSIADGCGGTLSCGSSTCATQGQICGGGGQPNVCGGGGVQATGGGTCTPFATCADTGKQCGPVADGCGGIVSCPATCPSPQVCGANGQASMCGGASQCTARTTADCATLGFNCGFIADGCGGLVQCGATCANGGLCGGDGLPNVCSGSGSSLDGGAGGGGVTTVNLSAGTVPANAAQIFDPSTHTVVTNDTTNNPSLVYPVNDTMFPQNIYRVLFQWSPHSLKLFQLSFTSPTLQMSVYSDGVHATCTKAATGGACWESAESNWQYLAGLNAGQDVTLKIRGVTSATATTIYESPAYTFHFSRQPVRGAIYYWSTTVQGVRRGALGDAAPTNFFTPAEAQNNCVACHTLSRNGKKLAAVVGGNDLTVVSVSATTPPPVVFGNIGTPKVSYPDAWSTFNPSTTRVISAEKGVMTLRDGTTGAAVSVQQPSGAKSATGLILPSTEKGTQPDWAPDGAHVVYARGSADRQGATNIGWMAVSGDSFSPIQNVVTVASGEVGYPMFSPTSDWIALVQGKSLDKDLFNQILIAPAQAGATTQLLVRANTLVNDYPAPNPPTTTTCSSSDKTRCIENGMPTWAPSGEPQIQWIAFASLRDYGVVLRSGSKIGAGMQQLWVAAIDTAKLGKGDPSYPAFRIPFVELTENAHRPFWAEDAINPPSCTPKTCANYPAGTCGVQSDGCGGATANCGGCGPGQTCGGGGPSLCGASGTCTAKTCADLGAQCGTLPNGCGGTVTCPTCTSGTCGGGGVAYQCGSPKCIASTCSQQGLECGSTGDGCGNVIECLPCPSGTTCGGGGLPNVCGAPACTPLTACPADKNCGDVPDGCGDSIHCGDCASGQSCGGGGAPNVCGAASCSPQTCAQLGGQCGSMSDQCGGIAVCGSCPSNSVCNSQNQCVSIACTPKTCGALGVECGPIADGCGGLLACGTCPSGQACGAGGVPGKCGANPCTPKSCRELGATCGQVADGCGGLTPDCGDCSGTQACKNGACVTACTPQTCADVGAQCGSIADGCGGLLDCGSCLPGQECGYDNQPNICGAPAAPK